MKQAHIYCIPTAPRQNGALWVEVTEDRRVIVKDPAGAWWRGREFTIEEFRDIINEGVKE